MENVSNLSFLDKLSPELRKEVQDAKPKMGQVFKFISTHPTARGSTVPPSDSIYDPYANDGEGAYVGIDYIVSIEPGKGKDDKPLPIYGRIQFTRTERAEKLIRGGDRSNELLFEYLYLTNYNRSNQASKDKKESKWFIPGKPAIFYMEQPAKSAAKKLEEARAIREAGEFIDKMAEDKLRDIAIGMDMKNITEKSSPDEIRVRLLNLASTLAGANQVLSLDKDVALGIKTEIKKAEKLKIIIKDTELNVWKWADGEQTFCAMAPGSNFYQSLVIFLMSPKGKETLKMIRGLLQVELDKQNK